MKFNYGLVTFFLCFSFVSEASNSLSYSGRLVNSDGSPVTGPVDLKFELAHTNSSGVGPVLCNQLVPTVPLTNGVFHVKLNFTCPSSTITKVLNSTPAGETAAIRVTNENSGKSYSFQALHSLPYSQVSNQLVQMGAVTGQVLSWNGSEWAPADGSSTDGTVKNILTGSGLMGGPITDSGTIAIAPGGVEDAHLATGISPAKLSGTRDSTKYLKGDNSWSSFSGDVLATILTGFSTASSAVVTATDSLIVALGKIQAQLTGKLDKTGGTLSIGTIDGVPTPVLPSQVVNKQYVDDQIVGVNPSKWTDNANGIHYSAGRVGIGTTAPTTQLHVHATSGDSEINISNSGNASQGFWIGSDDLGGRAWIGNFENGPLEFSTNGSEVMRLTAAGNVGIGTSTPGAKLEVVGTSGTTLKIVDGNQSLGKVLTSDANGVASWQTPSSSGTVTNVTGSGPISVATGNTTPVISIATANTSISGALSSADWNTFNNKLSSSLLSGRIFVGDASNMAAQVAMSGDATLTNSGVLNLNTVPISKGGTGATTQAGAVNAILPAQSGNTGKVLTTDGSNVSWESVLLTEADTLATVTGRGATTSTAVTFNGGASFPGNGVWNSSGNVGIGTTTPTTKLEVNGTVKATAFVGDGSSLTGVMGAPAGNNSEIQFNNSGLMGASSSLKWDASSFPALEVSGMLKLESAISGSGDMDGFQIKLNGSEGQVLNREGLISFWASSAHVMNMESGKVSIGSSSSVLDTDDRGLIIHNGYGIPGADAVTKYTTGYSTYGSGQLATDGFEVGLAFDNTAFLNQREAAPLIFKTSNTERIRIDSSGQVGIGTITPGAMLEVAGLVKITGGSPGSGKVLTSDGTGLASWVAPASGGISALTGDVTASGSGSVAATIANDAVTTGKILNGTILNEDIANTAIAYGKLNLSDQDIPIAKIARIACLTGEVLTSDVTLGYRCVADNSTDTTKLPLAGGTMTGNLTLAGDPTADLQAATKQYVDDKLTGIGDFMKDGSVTMTGQFKAIDGNSTTPAITFGADTATGLFRENTQSIGLRTSAHGKVWTFGKSITSPTSGGASMSGAAGTAAFPTYAFQGDADVGMFRATFDNLGFSTAGVERVRIDQNGGVGIGTSTPAQALHISRTDGNASVLTESISATVAGHSGLVMINYNTIGSSDSVNRVEAFGARGTKAAPSLSLIDDKLLQIMGRGYSGTDGFLGFNTAAGIDILADGNMASGSAPGRLEICTTSAGSNFCLPRVIVKSNGNVGIGTSTPTEMLHVNGKVLATAYEYTSDERLKKNVQLVSSPLEKVSRLEGVTFDWRHEEYPERNMPQGRTYGFIAQDVEKHVPELVSTGKDGFKSVQYGNITALLVESIKELFTNSKKESEERKKLERKVASLEEQNQKLQNEVDAIKVQHAKDMEELRRSILELKKK